jgi:hypothetical protein
MDSTLERSARSSMCRIALFKHADLAIFVLDDRRQTHKPIALPLAAHAHTRGKYTGLLHSYTGPPACLVLAAGIITIYGAILLQAHLLMQWLMVAIWVQNNWFCMSVICTTDRLKLSTNWLHSLWIVWWGPRASQMLHFVGHTYRHYPLLVPAHAHNLA